MAPPAEVEFQATPLVEVLEPMLKPDVLEQIKGKINSAGFLKPSALTAAGLETRFSNEDLELRLGVSPQLVKPSEIKVNPRNPPYDLKTALPLSRFSAYANLRSGVDYVELTGARQPQEGVQPFRLDIESAVNIDQWVVEGNLFYFEKSDYPFQRGDVRLVRDDPERAVRYMAGDLFYPVTSFQSFESMGGVGFSRNFSLQPYRVTEPLGQTSFFLRRPSRVEVIVNGRPVQIFQLNPGTHTLREFFLANGSNDVLLRIIDDVGQIELLHLSFFYDPRLLAEGEQDFSFNLGLPSRPHKGNYTYDDEEPSFSGFYRRGLSDTITLGANLQGDRTVQMGGLEASLATSWGTFNGETAFSSTRAFGFDQAARLQFIHYGANDPQKFGTYWSVGAQYLGEHFGTLANPAPRHAVEWDFHGRYSQRVYRSLSAGIGGSYQLRRGQPPTSGLNLSVNHRFRSSINASLNIDRNVREDRRAEWRAFVNLSWYIGRSGHALNFSHDTLSDISRLDWQHTPRYPIGSLASVLGVQRTRDTYSSYGQLNYVGYRGEALLSQDVVTPQSFDAPLESRTSLRAGTALVFADGQFGVTRPVTDSFAILAPHKSLKGKQIGIEPFDTHYTAKSDRFGPAILPDLRSYQIRRVAMEMTSGEDEAQLGDDLVTLLPRYKSGIVIRAGTGATIIIRGVLADAEGKPLSLQAGEVVSTTLRDWEAVTLVTNRDGQFYVDGFRPGRFQLVLFGNPEAKVQFELPEDAAGVYDLGQLKLPTGITLKP